MDLLLPLAHTGPFEVEHSICWRTDRKTRCVQYWFVWSSGERKFLSCVGSSCGTSVQGQMCRERGQEQEYLTPSLEGMQLALPLESSPECGVLWTPLQKAFWTQQSYFQLINEPRFRKLLSVGFKPFYLSAEFCWQGCTGRWGSQSPPVLRCAGLSCPSAQAGTANKAVLVWNKAIFKLHF